MKPPSVVSKADWPPNYVNVFCWRIEMLNRFRAEPTFLEGAVEYYRTRPAEFICHWTNTYDPRNAGGAVKDRDGEDVPSNLPLVLFQRQDDLIEFLQDCLRQEGNGLIEKCRDMGATWVCCAFSVWAWRFLDGAAIGWGSRKELLVDKLGDPDSIFEKMRRIIWALPREFWPNGFVPTQHMTYMKIVNPENGATITGEAGDNIGRGGRKLIYFKDEAQPLTSKVMTPNGFSIMGELSVGNYVLGADGNATKVIGINDCGEHPIYQFKFTDGTYAECSPNHIWSLIKCKSQREFRASEIAENFRYKSPGGQVKYSYQVPLCKPVKYKSYKELPLDPYVCGVLIGDGSIATGSIGFTSNDIEIVEEVRRLVPEGCIVNNAGGISYRIVDVLGRRQRWAGSCAKRAVKDAGIYGYNSQDKFIPPAYKFASPENRLAILQGLMDTDGSAQKGSACFISSSAKLSNDVQFLAQSLGGTATINKKDGPGGYGGCGWIYVTHVALPMGLNPFRLSRKITKYGKRSHTPAKSICGVKLLPPQRVRCITVEAADGLYLTDNFTVTHNSAHYERPELIEAALGDNTRIQIDISSVNGLGNVFHRKREAGVEWVRGEPVAKGKTNVFVMAWDDHPAKTEEWYEARREDAENNGLLHLFAQEIDRNYSAAVDGVIIPAEWVSAAIDAHVKLGFDDSGSWVAALDVADEGGDTNSLAKRKGVILKSVREWGERDTGVTARRAISECEGLGPIDIQYDCIGVGAGIKAETNRLEDEGLLPKGLHLVPWNAGAEVLYPDKRVIDGDRDCPINKDFFQNFKAQAWWALRRRFELTYRAINDPSFTWMPDDLISLPSDLPLLRKIQKELSQPTAGQSSRLKLMIEKKPDGTKSPNLADSIVMAFYPAKGGQRMTISNDFQRNLQSYGRRAR